LKREDGEYWAEWLQNHRVELNAMTTPEFIEWLNRKMAEQCSGKLIPPDDVLVTELEKRLEAKVRAAVTERILREAKFEGQVATALATIRRPNAVDLKVASNACSNAIPSANGATKSRQWLMIFQLENKSCDLRRDHLATLRWSFPAAATSGRRNGIGGYDLAAANAPAIASSASPSGLSTPLLLDWAVGMATGTAMFVAINTPNNPLVIAGFTLPGYAAIYSVILNMVVAVVLTPIFNALRGSKPDATVAADHRA
jgi:hypothetical protein